MVKRRRCKAIYHLSDVSVLDEMFSRMLVHRRIHIAID
jgi:hypothetical protein